MVLVDGVVETQHCDKCLKWWTWYARKCFKWKF